MPPQDYKGQMLESMLDLIWSQWITLGVSGNLSRTGAWIIDPEALISFTCFLGRYEPRIFDSMLEWIALHERLVNVQRLRRIAKESLSSGQAVLPAVAELFKRPTSAAKWRRLTKLLWKDQRDTERLFSFKDGSPHPHASQTDPSFESKGFERSKVRLRGTASIFDPGLPANLILRLRALLGLNSRAEVVAYLLTHDESHASRIARKTHYHPRTVYNTLSEMKLSGKLLCRIEGRAKLYGLLGSAWESFFCPEDGCCGWLNWPVVYAALEAFLQRDTTIASELALAVREVLPDLMRELPDYRKNSEWFSATRHVDRENLPRLVEELVRYLRTGRIPSTP